MATGKCKIMEKKQQNSCQCIDIQNYIPSIDFNKPKLWIIQNFNLTIVFVFNTYLLQYFPTEIFTMFCTSNLQGSK